VYVDDADDRWRDDVWTMKYLSGFKWEMLGEQVGMSTFQISSYALSHISMTEGKEADNQAYERQAHQARLRNEITQSRAEQGEYLRNVELARVLDKRKARKEAEGQTTTSTSDTQKNDGGKEKEGEKKERAPAKYRQREVADRSKGMEKKGMDNVLGSVFG
jgi:ESF2/ABP1 family protein